MKIELESPFKEKWKCGYIVVNPENRRNVILYNTGETSTTISYARYLMSVKLGYIVPDGLEVDHKDDDKTNDDINNLQILTKPQNREKADELFRSKRIPKHGTLTEYRYCKCDLCKEAKSVWMKQYSRDRNKNGPEA